MKLMILTAAVWPAEEIARNKLWIFLESCKKFGIEPHLYGCGNVFPGYIRMKLDMQLLYLVREQKNFTHVLYTDGWDAFFTGPQEEIIDKYKKMGSPPILSSAFYQLANVSEESKDYPGCFDESLLYRYPHVGGHLSEIPAIIDAFSKMNHDTGDDCFSWYDAWKEGWFRPELDSGCEIFQVTHDGVVDGLEVKKGRLHNPATGSNPCILHLSGGYTDQETGKDERLLPWVKKLT